MVIIIPFFSDSIFYVLLINFKNNSFFFEKKLALYLNAELENVTDVGPGGEDYEWHFKVTLIS